ncbi:MAG: prepilin-type N-terminal cleavage/methylation domain-containing protein [Acidobacteriota bacterium]
MGKVANAALSKRNRQAGYTVAELLIVVSLIGLVAMIAIPTAGRLIRHTNSLGAYSTVQQVLAGARLQAVKRGANVVVEISLTPTNQIRLKTFQDRANDTTSPLPADEKAAAGNFQQDTGTFATSPATDEPTLADFTVPPGVHLWKSGGTINDLVSASAFDEYPNAATVIDRVVFLPGGGILPPVGSESGLPNATGGRGIYFGDSRGMNFFRVTVDSNYSAKFRVDKFVPGTGYVSSGWTWN